MIKTMLVNTGKSYPIYIGMQLDDELVRFCHSINKRFIIISDANCHVMALRYQALLRAHQFDVSILTFPAGEQHKTRETKQYLEDNLLAQHYGRDTCIIALGGGVTTDLVGFLAATYCRGIAVIYIPTTLLAMVDSSIGGKTAVNTPYGKNLIGTFTQPKAVFMEMNHLAALPIREWRNGIVEMIKHGLIADAEYFNALSKTNFYSLESAEILLNLIFQSCLIKKMIVEIDEQEMNCRQQLNFGHTIGHAIEQLENYAISHGEAVAIGLIVESYLAVQLNLLPKISFQAIEDKLKQFKLPLKTSAFQDPQRFIQQLLGDKKSIAKEPRFILLNEIGQPRVVENVYSFPVPKTVLNDALTWAQEIFHDHHCYSV